MNDILFDHVLKDTTPNVSPPPDPSLNFSNVLLPKHKGKNFIAKKISKKYKKLDKKGQAKRIIRKSH